MLPSERLDYSAIAEPPKLTLVTRFHHRPQPQQEQDWAERPSPRMWRSSFCVVASKSAQ